MGQYSNRLSEKTEEDLNEIFNSISKYTGEFIDDYLAELDRRRMLWDMKIILKEKDLFTLTTKLESIPNSKYLNLLKRELEIRGLSEKYEREKNGFTDKDTGKSFDDNESIWTSISKYGGVVLLIAFLVKKFVLTNDINEEQKDYYPINQPNDHSYHINYPQQTSPHTTPKFKNTSTLDTVSKLKILDLEKNLKLDSSTLRILQDIDKSQKTSFDVIEKPTYLDLKNQNQDNKPFPIESNPFYKTNRIKFNEKKLDRTNESNKIDTNSKQAP